MIIDWQRAKSKNFEKSATDVIREKHCPVKILLAEMRPINWVRCNAWASAGAPLHLM
jgi:hypothetical protein